MMHPKDTSGNDITWQNAAALDNYVKALNDVADRLAEKNRRACSSPQCCSASAILCR